MPYISEIIGLLVTMTVVGVQSYMLTKLLLTKLSDFKRLKNYKRHACKDTCMCGDNVHAHSWGDNHAVVSEWDYYVENFKPTLRG